MVTFTKQLGRNKYQCLLTEHEFRSEADAEAHQEKIIRRLQAQGLLGDGYNGAELFKAFDKSRKAA